MFYLFVYFLTFSLILYLFHVFNKQNPIKYKFSLFIFVFLYFIFCYFYFDYFNWYIWISAIPLFYSLLEDSLLSEFDIRFPILSVILFNIFFFDLSILVFALILFFILFIFTKLKYLSDGEPYLIIPFLFIIPIEYWFNFFLVSSLIGIFILLFNYLFFKIKSMPFSYFLFISLIIHISYYGILQ